MHRRLGLSALSSGGLALWLGAIAVIAAQNGTPVAVKFLIFQSVPLPLGLMLAIGAIVGVVGTALTLWLWAWAAPGSARR